MQMLIVSWVKKQKGGRFSWISKKSRNIGQIFEKSEFLCEHYLFVKKFGFDDSARRYLYSRIYISLRSTSRVEMSTNSKNHIKNIVGREGLLLIISWVVGTILNHKIPKIFRESQVYRSLVYLLTGVTKSWYPSHAALSTKTLYTQSSNWCYTNFWKKYLLFHGQFYVVCLDICTAFSKLPP